MTVKNHICLGREFFTVTKWLPNDYCRLLTLLASIPNSITILVITGTLQSMMISFPQFLLIYFDFIHSVLDEIQPIAETLEVLLD